tara:strand:- start:18492 stop:20486 length:1995 start_codon:yes stop_codon:yes gene_type:complete
MPGADPPSDSAALPRLGVDTGGTFTDFALYSEGQLRTHKVLSTPEGPEKAILQGIEEMGLAKACKQGKLLVIHGSTVATNAVLEGKGAKTLFITNSGLEDILTIGRQNRENIYDLRPQKKYPPIDSELFLGVSGRLDSQGNQIEPFDSEELDQLLPHIKKLAPESIAVCMLFSYLAPAHEKAIEAKLKEDYFVSISSDVLPETGEYERGIATWLNASLGPLMDSYLTRLAHQIPEQNLFVMQSSGGTISCVQASRKPVNLLLSGPAGGLAAASAIKDQISAPGLLTFDMGGTSTDVALIKQGIRLTREGKVGRYPVSVPMADMHTIGAGGGSMAYLDDAGMLHVGPESAGANPGPACYGLGGAQATVTDAHMLLGNLKSSNFAGGNIELDRDASEKTIGALAKEAGMQIEEMALAILELANEHMARALRQISEQRGEDPAGYRLCSFGGAGGLHVCALAEKLEIRQAIIPANSGILSALGMLQAPGKRELSTVILDNHKENLSTVFSRAEKLATQGRTELNKEGYINDQITQNFSLNCRYLGQTFTLEIPLSEDSTYVSLEAAFHCAHESNFGYRLNRDMELVNLRAHLIATNKPLELSGATNNEIVSPLEMKNGLVYRREDLVNGQEILGPALICEASSTSWIADEWMAKMDQFGHLLLNRTT